MEWIRVDREQLAGWRHRRGEVVAAVVPTEIEGTVVVDGVVNQPAAGPGMVCSNSSAI